MKNQIESILNNILPNAYTSVSEIERLRSKYLKIVIAASDYQINGVSGQFPACVSLCLDLDSLELEAQIFGGNGGNRIFRKPRKHLDAEKYLALGSEKVAFRRPKKEEKAILRAVERFAENWRKTVASVIDEMQHLTKDEYLHAISK